MRLAMQPLGIHPRMQGWRETKREPVHHGLSSSVASIPAGAVQHLL
jgi:hypothetical protein